MKPKINDACIACGTCESICPEVFKIEGDKAVVLDADYDALKDKIKEAIEACPVEAITN